MPLTLEKLFSATVEATLDVLGETLHLTWAPSRYTGEMDDLAAKMAAEETTDQAEYDALLAAGDTKAAAGFKSAVERKQAAQVRVFVAQLLVAWDFMDGRKPHPHDEESLKKLPDWFVLAVFNALSEENVPDPPKAPSSDATSSPKGSSARSQRGTTSSGARKSSGSRRGT